MALSPIQIKMTKRLLQSGNEVKIAHAIEKFHPSDITILFSELDANETQKLIDSLFLIAKAGKTLLELPEFLIPDILELIEDKKLTTIISRLEPDDALFLLEMVPEVRWKMLLANLPAPQRIKLDKLLLYPKDSAGSVMTSSFISVHHSMTVEQAIKSLRQQPETQGIFYIYVVDDNNRLVGVQSLRNLVTSPAGTRVKDIMTQDVYSVMASTHQEKAAQMVDQYHLLAIPVVNEGRELVGVITIDDVIDIVKEEATEDIYNLAGLSEEDRATTPVMIKVKKRLPWLILNLLTAGMSVMVISIFQRSIEQVVALAVFMSVVTGVGGNSAIQSLTVITRAIALGELAFIKVYKAILKELLNGLILGVIGGVIMGIICFLLKGNVYLGLVLASAMVLNLVTGGFIGALVPVLFKSLKLDPAVGTSVIVTMATDALGNLFFLGLATLMLHYLVPG